MFSNITQNDFDSILKTLKAHTETPYDPITVRSICFGLSAYFQNHKDLYKWSDKINELANSL